VTFSDLPAVNASLNGLSAVFLVAGFVFIRRKNQKAHERCMKSAVLCSALFLICYLVYHSQAGRTVFRNPEYFRKFYLALLLTHTVLAVTIIPMIIVTYTRAIKLRFDLHKRIARWTWPVWMYVSVTGVVIYLLLYHIYPQTR
jgi:uncharacterized membrane protein YozB (DUF420 family)